jgi:hypothetical protein
VLGAAGARLVNCSSFERDGSPVTARLLQNSNGAKAADVAVISFASGVGLMEGSHLLSDLSVQGAKTGKHQEFDSLFVIDPAFSWYTGCSNGAADPEKVKASVAAVKTMLSDILKPYKRVVFTGTSMGGTACLLFASLADRMVALCPQVQLDSYAGWRPHSWQTLSPVLLDLLKAELSCLPRPGRNLQVHVSQHLQDVRQISLLPAASGLEIVSHPESASHGMFLGMKELKELLLQALEVA